MMCKGWAALILLFAAPAAGVRSGAELDEESEDAVQASIQAHWQGYCQRIKRGTYMKFSKMEIQEIADVCASYVSGENSPGFFVWALKHEKCILTSAEELGKMCPEALQVLAAPSIDDCVSAHEGYPKNAKACSDWDTWIRFSYKNPYKKFHNKPGIYIEGCYKERGNAVAALCKKYTTFCSTDARNDENKKWCDDQKFNDNVQEDREDKPMWKDPYQVTRSRILSEAKDDSDKCLQAFYETFTDLVTNPVAVQDKGKKHDQFWDWFKKSACTSFDEFVSANKYARRHFQERAKVQDKDVCTKGDSNLINIHCRAYAGVCTAEEGSDLFALPADSMTYKFGDHWCNDTKWQE